METSTKELYHRLSRFNLAGDYDFTILQSFIDIVENAVGKPYYENLFYIYDSFFDLIQNYPNFKDLRQQNNAYLTSYSDCVQSLGDIASDPIYKKSLKTMAESLLEIHYQKDLNEKIERIKQDIDAIMDIVSQANEIMRPTEEIEPAIADLKTRLSQDVSNIKTSYNKLRVLGELELYSRGCKNQCRAEFFERLWDLLSKESEILIECANLAMRCVIKPILTTSEISEQEIARANNLFNQYQSLSNDIVQMKNDNQM